MANLLLEGSPVPIGITWFPQYRLLFSMHEFFLEYFEMLPYCYRSALRYVRLVLLISIESTDRRLDNFTHRFVLTIFFFSRFNA